jgi:hypothetical protein
MSRHEDESGKGGYSLRKRRSGSRLESQNNGKEMGTEVKKEVKLSFVTKK